MTDCAERLLRRGYLFAASGEYLLARYAQFGHQPRTAIRSCATSMDQPDNEAWRVLLVHARDNEKQPLVVLVSATLWSEEKGYTPASLVVVNIPGNSHAASTTMLAKVFGLTPAESAVTSALRDGRSLSQHAVSAGISVLTARTLLKRALEKTDTHSQAELVGLLLRSSVWQSTPRQ
jgi:DNA-binding CsgD family transcriptional regulator